MNARDSEGEHKQPAHYKTDHCPLILTVRQIKGANVPGLWEVSKN